MRIYTIGFTQISAEDFFGRLADAGVRRLLDVRLNNTSQLAGFAKARDLPYFLAELVGVEYAHEPLLAPTQELLDAYKKDGGSWQTYQRDFMALLEERRIDRVLDPADFAAPTALLCSEPTAKRCHRRLVCEYLTARWPDVHTTHL